MAKKKRVRPDAEVKHVLAAMITYGAVRIVLTYLTGEASLGAAFFPVQIYFIGFFVFLFVLRRGVRGLIRQYAAKSLYLNAEEEYRRALFKTLVPSVLFGAVMIVLCMPVATLFTGSSGAFPGFLISGIILLTLGFQGVMEGYFEGLQREHGTGRYAYLADVIRVIASAAGGIGCGYLLYGYGVKVDALLMSDANRYIYGAFGLLCGMLIGNMCALLVLFIAMLSFRKKRKALVEKSKPKYLTDTGSLLRTSVPLSLAVVMPVLSVICSAWIYVRREVANGWIPTMTGLGVFDTHFLSVMVVAAFVVVMLQVTEVFATGSRSTKEDGETTAARVLKVLHRLAIRVFPVSTLLMALSKQTEQYLFADRAKEGSTMLACGSLTLSAIAFCTVSVVLLQLKKKHHLLIMNSVLSAACGVLITFTVSLTPTGTLNGLTAGCALMFLLYAVFGCYSVARVFGIDKRFMIQVLLTPLLAAAVSALIVFLAANAGEPNPVVFGVALIAGGVLYLVLLILFGGLTDAEAKLIPGGSALKAAGARARSYARDGFAERKRAKKRE